jgi:type I restriction enzyme S subunit
MKDNDIEYVPFSSIAEVNPRVSITHLSSDMSVSFIPMSDVTETGQWIHHQEQKLENLLGHGYTFFQEGDILFAKITPCMENGKGAHAIGLVKGIGFGTTEFHVLRAKTGASDRFIYHWLQSDLLRLKAEALMIGSAGQRRVTPKFFDIYTIPSLSLSEQKRIANILDAIDEQIQHAEQIIAKIKLQREGLLHKLLTCGIDENGQLRDPIAHPEQFKNSILGKIPREWEVRRLEDLYSIPARNGLYKPSRYYGRGILMIHMPQMFRGLIIDPSDATRVEITPSELERFQLMPGDLVFARRSLNFEGAGQCSLISDLPEKTTYESSIIRVRLRVERIKPAFVNYFLNSDLGFRLRVPLIRQVAVSGVSSEDIAGIPIPCPSIKEQELILAVLDIFRSAELVEEDHLEKLELFKKGLMQDLLTGRVRVVIEENLEG